MHEAPVPLHDMSGTDLRKLPANLHVESLHNSRRYRTEWIKNVLDPEDVV